jgi:cutinase
MKFFTAVSLFAGLGAALPTAREAVSLEDALVARQLLGNTRNELQNGGTCPKVIFIFARGSTESGNLVCIHPRNKHQAGILTNRL